VTFAPFDLSGHVSLVTGGNRGIGLGIAVALTRAGADVAILGRDHDRNSEAVAQLSAIGSRVLGLDVDVAVEAEVVAACAAVVAELGRIDSVFANAGIGGATTPLLSTSTEDFHAVLRVNLDGVFWTLREAGRHMVDRALAGDSGGSLVALASVAAMDAAPRQHAYAASKAGLVALVKATAVELARYDVRANVIAPGWIETEMTANLRADARVAQRVGPRIPMRRWGQPEDLGGIAVYLASGASSYHTGDVLVVDGGYSVF
jgi:NAD(P)-dependent dehydrogenase (short-subunit alcohol dehydrogenase family)